jgi:hypothetical protein
MSVYAVDMMQEQGKVLVLGRSVPEEAEEAKNRAIPVPFGAIGCFHNRIVVKDLKTTFELTSPTSVKVMMLLLSVYCCMITTHERNCETIDITYTLNSCD